MKDGVERVFEVEVCLCGRPEPDTGERATERVAQADGLLHAWLSGGRTYEIEGISDTDPSRLRVTAHS